MRIYALLLAKKESRRLPGKNYMEFYGKPMFQWNLEKCLNIFPRVYVSSDYQPILDRAEELGAIPIKRPKELCEKDVPNIPVYKHAVETNMNTLDAFVAVQVNSPTVSSSIIKLAYDCLRLGFNEVKTCHSNWSDYGSVWGMSVERLEEYWKTKNFYHPYPDVKILDNSIDIHTYKDFQKALCQIKSQLSQK